MKRIAFRLGVVLSAGVVLCGCNSGGSDRADGDEVDAQVLDRYVAAVAGGDVDEAMTYRCEAARIPSAQWDLFAEQARRLVTEVGPLAVAESVVLASPTGLLPLDGTSPEELSYRISTGDEITKEPLVTVVVDEGGERRLCGFATQSAERLWASFDGVPDAALHARPLTELLPDLIDRRFTLVSDGASELNREAGEVEAWSRSWQHVDYGGATATAVRYASSDAASAAADAQVKAVLSDAIESFNVDSVPEAVGVRKLGFAWLWVQPPGVGPVLDQVVILSADTTITIRVSHPTPEADKHVIRSLVDNIGQGDR